MGTSIIKPFSKNEIITIHELDTESTIDFDSKKELYLKLDPSKSIIDCFYASIEDWISRVEINRDKYSIEVLAPIEKSYGGVSITYEDRVIAKLYLNHSVSRLPNGKRCLSITFQCKYIKESDIILGNDLPDTYFIDDRYFNTTQIVKDKKMSLIEILDYLIPTRSDAIVQGISYVFKVHPKDIIIDSFRKKYIISTPYLFQDSVKSKHPDIFYKYTSLSVFRNMLEHRSFRMNSIVCQSDESESLYFGDFLCAEYDSEKDKGSAIIKESNVLISSFTTVPNNQDMWKDYGDNGRGVMLGFTSIGGKILSAIQYIDEESLKFKSIKNAIMDLKENEIQLYFSEIDDKHRFLKNNKYEYEKEWRLVKEYDGKLSNTVYKDDKNDIETYALYHDFPFQNDIIPDLKLQLVSVTFGPKQRHSNIFLLTKETLECFGDDIRIHSEKNITI